MPQKTLPQLPLTLFHSYLEQEIVAIDRIVSRVIGPPPDLCLWENPPARAGSCDGGDRCYSEAVIDGFCTRHYRQVQCGC